MQINLKKDAFLGQLFPGLKDEDWQDDSRLAQFLRNAYSRGGYTPEVKIEEETVQISVDEHKVAKVNKVYQDALNLASKGAYDRAKALIKPLLDEGTQNAELFRIYGQCLAEEGDKEGATNYLIDALKWDPNHTDSLIMMGNLYAEGDGDLETAQVFFDKVMELEPENYVALNNIGGVLAKSGQLEQAATFFNRVLEAKPGFPNALYGLALGSFKGKVYSPRFVRDANITLSFTQLFLFKELFGLDMTGEMKEPRLQKKAEKLYDDFLKMRDDKEPGEEYDLVQWWGEDLELKGMYRLVEE